MANPDGEVMDEAPEGFYFVENKQTGLITIAYSEKLWEAVWDKKNFVGYRRKNSDTNNQKEEKNDEKKS